MFGARLSQTLTFRCRSPRERGNRITNAVRLCLVKYSRELGSGILNSDLKMETEENSGRDN